LESLLSIDVWQVQQRKSINIWKDRPIIMLKIKEN
jgi:hypothetical protein